MQKTEGQREEVQREGRYANYCDVAHTPKEFVFDFGQFYQPESSKAHIHTRIVIIPACAKALLETLRHCVTRYEKNFGTIEEK